MVDEIPEDRISSAARIVLDVAFECYGRATDEPDSEHGFLAVHALLTGLTESKSAVGNEG